MDFLTSLVSGNGLLYGLILLPLLFAVIILLLPKKSNGLHVGLYAVAGLADVVFSIAAGTVEGASCKLPFCGMIELSLSTNELSKFIIFFLGIFICLNAIYGAGFMRKKDYAQKFTALVLISAAMANGAVLSDNIITMLFFWEGFMCTLFGLLLIGNTKTPKTALKCLTINGVADLMLMLGIAATVYVAGTADMAGIAGLPIEGIGAVGFACMVAGAIGKAGAMPFHSWIPDAAEDAPMPFLSIFPGALEKFLGIYLLARVACDFYAMPLGGTASTVIMIIGAATLLFAVAMALIQKDMKKVLAYDAVSQVGYMVLSIGTGLTVGVVGGLFHMINYVIYKVCLFMSVGSIEHSVGTTDMSKFSGIGKKMPITMICFIIAGLSIAGVPPFNGFFSKELIFDAAYEVNIIFYIVAVIGAFGTAAVVLKMGHTAFFGKESAPAENTECKESPVSMLIPMIILALSCIFFGVCNHIPLRTWIQPIFGGEDFSGWPHSAVMVIISVIVLALAVLNHIYGYRKTGSGFRSLDHIRNAPVFKQIYNLAEMRIFDPYEWIMAIFNALSFTLNAIERAINWFYDVALVWVASQLSYCLKRTNNGSIEKEILWSLLGIVGMLVIAVCILWM